ncbi:LLM class F420-dependent oxidoreductase [Actinomadura montaniterrae]|uniref:LLM class F420-dependent oxidoreductase n=1 Tax=Actinomadura montaniterrae TaxID=1803903 RepID=A0A6L3VZA5_9ACTN|nr:LLM class F420-dependent oxidoreductase [Actinomadura montaniterrae]KAB2381323.1 LLM class F420-dependent oxidoreductase [Actinomadura montaniterrae]
MKYAVLLPVAAGVTADPAWIGEYVRHAEDCGYESVGAVEHAVVASGYSSVYPYDSSGRMELADDLDIPDPLDLLAYLAGRTSRIGLATGVLVLPNHHPVVLAKRLATIDALSGGRLRLVVGMGWMREEIEACGADFDSRGRRGDEQLQVLRKLWAETGPEGASHDGEFFHFKGAMSYPKPVQEGGVPIHVGGHTKAAARRAGRYGDGLQPLGVAGDELRGLVALMREEAEKNGRDPDALELTLGHSLSAVTPEKAGRLGDLGAGRLVLRGTVTTDLNEAKDELSACAQRLGLS